MSAPDVAEEIRCALAMRDAGYAVLFDHETSAELLRRYDALVKALEGIAEFSSADATTLGAIARLVSIRNTALRALAAAGRAT